MIFMHIVSFPRPTIAPMGARFSRASPISPRVTRECRASRRRVVTRIHVRNADRSFIRTEVLPARRTYKALILAGCLSVFCLISRFWRAHFLTVDVANLTARPTAAYRVNERLKNKRGETHPEKSFADYAIAWTPSGISLPPLSPSSRNPTFSPRHAKEIPSIMKRCTQYLTSGVSKLQSDFVPSSRYIYIFQIILKITGLLITLLTVQITEIFKKDMAKYLKKIFGYFQYVQYVFNILIKYHFSDYII